MSGEEIGSRSDYRHFYALDTRWADNDIYGHINNVVYYSYIDSVVNRFLIDEAGLDINAGSIVGFVVSSGCDYLKPAAYPDALQAGLRVDHLGNSSVRYGVGIFRKGEDSPCARGFSVHVFVARPANRPVPLPDTLRRALETLLAD